MNESTSPAHSLLSFRNRHLDLKDENTGEVIQVLMSCEADGTLFFSESGSSYPAFMEKIQFNSFPDNKTILSSLSKSLGKPLSLISAENVSVELDNSALSGLQKMPVDIFDDVYLGEVKPQALVLCVDIRNFSSFLCCNDEGDVFKLIKEFTSNLLSCVNQFGYGCSYYKLMGDGAIVIWDETNEDSVASALGVFDSYIEFVNEELFKPYPGLGMAGALVSDKVYKYEISAEASQLKYRDYVGYGINLSCRLQALAKKDQLAINRALADSTLVPSIENREESLVDDLHKLKGLKEEDRGVVFFYDR